MKILLYLSITHKRSIYISALVLFTLFFCKSTPENEASQQTGNCCMPAPGGRFSSQAGAGEDGFEGIAPVMSFEPNGFGLVRDV